MIQIRITVRNELSSWDPGFSLGHVCAEKHKKDLKKHIKRPSEQIHPNIYIESDPNKILDSVEYVTKFHISMYSTSLLLQLSTKNSRLFSYCFSIFIIVSRDNLSGADRTNAQDCSELKEAIGPAASSYLIDADVGGPEMKEFEEVVVHLDGRPKLLRCELYQTGILVRPFLLH